MTVAPASESWLLRFAPWTRTAWVTLASTVYYPAHVREPLAHPSILAHEYVHIEQWRRYNVLLWIGYMLGVPLPFYLSLIRIFVECEAYAHEVVHYGREPRLCVDAMCSRTYGWLGPRSLVQRLLERAIRAKR